MSKVLFFFFQNHVFMHFISYGPGDLCVFYSSYIYHKVSKFFPKVQTEEERIQKITPGRIGSVYFFPKESFKVLDGKPKLWGRRTGFGKYEAFYNNAYLPVELRM